MEFLGRAYFHPCLALGRLLRSTRYSKARIVFEDGKPVVRKSRAFYAPLLVLLSDPLMRILGTGVRILSQRGWEERELAIYRCLYDSSIRIEADGVLGLPLLPGKTLANLLEVATLEHPVRMAAIEASVVALAKFHRKGFTHGDAMAENVLVDAEAGVARWFDFETIHDSSRSVTWRRADDVRALLTTCLIRTAPDERAETLDIILNACEDVEVTRILATSFASVWQRPLAFHLAQAGLSFHCFLEIGRLLRERAEASECPR